MELPGPLAKPSLRYRPRHAAASPLYRLVSDHLEEYLLKPRLAADKRPVPHPVIERSFRSFLECGIHRFGECLNLHVHIHAVVSDGVFSSPGLLLGPRLLFHEAPQPTDADISRLTETIRRKVLKRFSRLGIISKETVSGMLAWPNSGFSLHAKVAVNAQDREGLERLLRYCARPALSIKRLSYHPEKNFAVYRTDGRDTGKPRTLYIEPVEFLRRFALLAPPPNKNTVRYYGALGPNAPLRPLLVKEAQELSGKENRARKIPALRKVAVLERAKEGLRAATRSWAACLARVFEVEPLKCGRCSGELIPMAAILADRELERLLAYLELPTELPKTAPARSPPFDFGEEGEPESQVS